MYAIDVMQENKDAKRTLFRVIVAKGDNEHEYEVIVPREYFSQFSGIYETPEKLVKKSFEFLLEREAPDMILTTFELPKIQTFFPDYETWLRSCS